MSAGKAEHERAGGGPTGELKVFGVVCLVWSFQLAGFPSADQAADSGETDQVNKHWSFCLVLRFFCGEPEARLL